MNSPPSLILQVLWKNNSGGRWKIPKLNHRPVYTGKDDGWMRLKLLVAITTSSHPHQTTTTTQIQTKYASSVPSTMVTQRIIKQQLVLSRLRSALAITLAFTLPTVHTFTLPSPSSKLFPTSPATQSSLSLLPGAENIVVDSAGWVGNEVLTGGSSHLLAFADQGQNLAGIFFQASLLPYLLFLYFLSFRANRLPALGNFGFQFVLLFVISTIPSGIISKSVYGYSLADTDWLHGGAESLLTIANILIVCIDFIVDCFANQSRCRFWD